MKKCLALLLVVVTIVSVFAGCGASSGEITLPKVTVEDTLENRQAAIVEMAKAFWRKNPYMQYDNKSLNNLGTDLGCRAMTNWESTPESASWDLPVYTVCSAFAYDAIYQSFEYSLLERRPSCLTKDISAGNHVPPEIIVFQHVNDPENNELNVQKMNEGFALLQPGDVITYTRPNNSGHTVIFVGDLDGDGKGDILHSDGKTYDFTTGLDTVEENGTIWFNHTKAPSAEDFLCNPDFSEYLPAKVRWNIIRPALLNAEEYPLTAPIKTRLTYPDMAIFFTAECGNYGSVNADGELTYTLTVENHGTQDYTGLNLQIPAPQNAKIVKVNGEETTKQAVRIRVDIPAGSSADLTITVVPTAGVGSRIIAEGGYVHTIPLPRIITSVQKSAFDKQAVADALKANEGKDGIDFVNGVLKTLSADAPEIPEPLEVLNALFARKNIGDIRMYQPKEAEALSAEEQVIAKMQVPEYFGGMKVMNPPSGNHRVRTTRYRDLKPGDVVLWATNSLLEESCGVFDGEYLVTAQNGKNMSQLEYQFEKLLSYDFFIVLRPTQAM